MALRWEDELLDMNFPSSLDEEIGTRLGLQDRRLRINPPVEGPFGEQLEEVVIPGWMAGGIGEEIEVVTVEVKEGALLLRAGERIFQYDRRGLVLV